MADDLSDHWIAPAFNFRVSLRKSTGSDGADTVAVDGGFQECSGLEIQMDVQELQEGGRNDGVVRLVGRGKYSNVVLKRGMFYTEGGPVSSEFWEWIQDIVSGGVPYRRYDGTIEVLDRTGGDDARVLATWSFSRGLPAKVSGPQLNAQSGQLAIEELHIAHEGLLLEARG